MDDLRSRFRCECHGNGLDAHVRAVVDQAPPPTDEQVRRVVAALGASTPGTDRS